MKDKRNKIPDRRRGVRLDKRREIKIDRRKGVRMDKIEEE